MPTCSGKFAGVYAISHSTCSVPSSDRDQSEWNEDQSRKDDELVELKVPYPDSELDGYRPRTPDLVWHKWRTDDGVDVDGFILLLNSQLRSPQPNKPMFGPLTPDKTAGHFIATILTSAS
jgi:hypothetical protein